MANEEYVNNVLNWRKEMDTNLRRENGWLSLAGLFWLRNGQNIIGSDTTCDILLPPRAPKRLGTFEFDGNNVTLNVEADTVVEVNGMTTKTALLDADQEDVPSFITFDDMRMVVVRRSKGVGIRLWDNTQEKIRTFPSREWYPITNAFRLPAIYTRFESPKIVPLPDILGATMNTPMHGVLRFSINEQNFELQVTEEPDHSFFIQFMDLTNGKLTYPSGRYCRTEPYKENEQFFLDFNKAYNIHCAFTDYATCTFPPPENHLKIPIEAGEIYIKH
ncbi:MAG TPA: DUF1684 domain-containing protein [Anaerolineales bacterium]|nr:DUF1684 domain-containing protein [Anaerolineales bacterium]